MSPGRAHQRAEKVWTVSRRFRGIEARNMRAPMSASRSVLRGLGSRRTFSMSRASSCQAAGRSRSLPTAPCPRRSRKHRRALNLAFVGSGLRAPPRHRARLSPRFLPDALDVRRSLVLNRGAAVGGGWSARRRSKRSTDSTVALGAGTAAEATAHPRDTLSLVPKGPLPEDLAIAELVQIEPVVAIDVTRAIEVPLNPELSRILSSLSSIVGGAASTVPAALANASGKLYELRFTPEITRQLADGTLTMPSTWKRESKSFLPYTSTL
jgi:hypothetical protein